MSRLLPLAHTASLAFALGCAKKAEESARESASKSPVASTSIVEVYERGQIAWNVDENGQLLARVQDEGGSNASRKANGTIEWNDGVEVRRAKLSYDEEVEGLVAQGPVPEGDLTEIRYALVYDGEPSMVPDSDC